MYTLHKRPRTVAVRRDGSTTYREEPGETRTFRTAAGLLRFVLSNGIIRQHGSRPAKRPDELYLGRPGTRSYGMVDSFSRWEVTYDHIEAMRRAQQRYREIVHYLWEVEPEWRPDTSVSASGEVHYADNSIELHEVDKYDNKRTRMVAYPSGDVCF